MLLALRNFRQFIKLSMAYLYKNNPLLIFVNTISTNVSDVLSSQKKQKIAKYRLNHVKYRLYQMEQIIESGNPYNLVEGKKLDRLQ